MKNFPRFKAALLGAAILGSACLSAQTNDSIMQLNTKYRTEIGIDMSGFLQRNGAAGTALIVKVRSGRLNYRFQAGLHSSLILSQKFSSVDPNLEVYDQRQGSSLGVNAMFGLEKVKSYGRFNFYYGVDLGPSYSSNISGYALTSNSIGAQQSVSESVGGRLAPFIGAKFRFSEHFSASIESCLWFSWLMNSNTTKTLIYAQGMGTITTRSFTQKTSDLQTSMSYMRFLTLNYHL